MKFLLIVLLLISEPFSIIKTGMGLKCIWSDNTHCLHLLNISKNSLPETELEKFRINNTDCIKQRDKMNTTICSAQDTKCSQLFIKFKDGHKAWVRSCNSTNDNCEVFKQDLLKFHKSHVDQAECAYCDTDGCNLDLENNLRPAGDSKPEGNSTTEDTSSSEDKSLNCYTTTENTCVAQIKLFKAGTDSLAENPFKTDEFLVNAARDELVSCLKKLRGEKLDRCEAYNTTCYTLTVKLKDGTTTSFKSCRYNTSSTECEYMKEIFDGFKKDLDYAKCTYCSTNGCNLNPVPAIISGGNSEDKSVTPEAFRHSRANEVPKVAALVLMTPFLVSLF